MGLLWDFFQYKKMCRGSKHWTWVFLGKKKLENKKEIKKVQSTVRMYFESAVRLRNVGEPAKLGAVCWLLPSAERGFRCIMSANDKGADPRTQCSCLYHDAITGAWGEADVVRVRRDALVPLRDVLSNVPANAIHSLAGAVGAWAKKNTAALAAKEPGTKTLFSVVVLSSTCFVTVVLPPLVILRTTVNVVQKKLGFWMTGASV